jgi:hypothetical protein
VREAKARLCAIDDDDDVGLIGRWCIQGVRRLYVSTLDLVPEVIPSQKCHMNIGTVRNGYRARIFQI